MLILLHGIRSNELAMAALAAGFDPRFRVLSVRSPKELGPFAFGWLAVDFTPEGPRVDVDEARAAWERLGDLVDEAVSAFDADRGRVYLAGFSQGGILALAAMLTVPEKLAGAVCMSGRLMPEVLPAAAPSERLRGKPVLVVHGTTDETLEVGYGRSAAGTLIRLGLDVAYEELEMGHTTTDASIAVVNRWLSRQLDR
jgi:phospholipase/carboxylesterase